MPGSTALHQVLLRQPSPFLSLSYPSGVVVAQNPKARSWLFSFAPFFVTATQSASEALRRLVRPLCFFLSIIF